MENGKIRIGGLWSRKTNKDEKFLSGTVKINGEEIGLLIFKNSFMENPKAPNFVVYQVPLRKPYNNESADVI